MKVIDCRNRPTTKEFMGFFGNPRLKSFYDNILHIPMPKEASLEEWVNDLDKAGIAKAVCTGRDLETAAGWKVPNEHIASIVNRYPDRVIGVAGIDPLKGKKAVQELEHTVKQLGFRGCSIDPARCGLTTNDRKLYPIYEKCLELDVPVFLTMGPLPTEFPLYLKTVHPMFLDEVATEMKELKLVCSHAVWPFTHEMIAVAFRHPNVYIEPSIYWKNPGAELLVAAANAIISDKIVYATAYPFALMTDVAEFKRLPFTAEVKKKVMYDNAARMLKL